MPNSVASSQVSSADRELHRMGDPGCARCFTRSCYSRHRTEQSVTSTFSPVARAVPWAGAVRRTERVQNVLPVGRERRRARLHPWRHCQPREHAERPGGLRLGTLDRFLAAHFSYVGYDRRGCRLSSSPGPRLRAPEPSPGPERPARPTGHRAHAPRGEFRRRSHRNRLRRDLPATRPVARTRRDGPRAVPRERCTQRHRARADRAARGEGSGRRVRRALRASRRASTCSGHTRRLPPRASSAGGEESRRRTRGAPR